GRTRRSGGDGGAHGARYPGNHGPDFSNAVGCATRRVRRGQPGGATRAAWRQASRGTGDARYAGATLRGRASRVAGAATGADRTGRTTLRAIGASAARGTTTPPRRIIAIAGQTRTSPGARCGRATASGPGRGAAPGPASRRVRNPGA